VRSRRVYHDEHGLGLSPRIGPPPFFLLRLLPNRTRAREPELSRQHTFFLFFDSRQQTFWTFGCARHGWSNWSGTVRVTPRLGRVREGGKPGTNQPVTRFFLPPPLSRVELPVPAGVAKLLFRPLASLHDRYRLNSGGDHATQLYTAEGDRPNSLFPSLFLFQRPRSNILVLLQHQQEKPPSAIVPMVPNSVLSFNHVHLCKIQYHKNSEH
jgi:hypothetical protein